MYEECGERNKLWREICDKIEKFKTMTLPNVKQPVDKISFDVLADDLFVKMMLDFSDEVVIGGKNDKNIQKQILFNASEFKADAIVMHRFLALWMYRFDEVSVSFQEDDHNLTRCRLFGIITRIYNDYGVFPHNKVLMIRQDEPTPVSRLVNFEDMT